MPSTPIHLHPSRHAPLPRVKVAALPDIPPRLSTAHIRHGPSISTVFSTTLVALNTTSSILNTMADYHVSRLRIASVTLKASTHPYPASTTYHDLTCLQSAPLYNVL